MKEPNFVFNQNTFLNHGWLNIPKEIIERFNATNDAPYGTLEAMITMLIHVNYSERSYTVGDKKINCKRAESIRSFADWAKIFHWTWTKTKRYFLWLQSIGYIQFIDDPDCCSHFIVLFYNEIMFGPRYTSAQKRMNKINEKNNTTNCHTVWSDGNEAMESNEAMEDQKDVPMDLGGTEENRRMMESESQESSHESQESGSESQDPTASETGTNRRSRKEIADFKHQEFLKFWNTYHEITGVQRKNIGKAEMEWNKLTYRERKSAMENINNYYYSQESIYFILQASSYLANKAFLDDFIY